MIYSTHPLQSELLLPVVFNDEPSLNVFKFSILSFFPGGFLQGGWAGFVLQLGFFCLLGSFYLDQAELLLFALVQGSFSVTKHSQMFFRIIVSAFLWCESWRMV